MFNYLHDSISIFRAGRIVSENISGGTVSPPLDSTAGKIYPKSLKNERNRPSWSDSLIFKIYALSVLGDPYPHLIVQPKKRRPMPCNAPLLALPTLFPPISCVLALLAALVSTSLGFISSASLPDTGRRSTQVHSVNGLEKVHAAREHDHVPIFALISERKEFFMDTSMAYGTMEAFESCATWIVPAKWLNLPLKRNKRLPRPWYVTRFKKGTSPNRSPHVSPEPLGQSVGISPRRFCPSCVVLLAPGSPLVFYVSCAVENRGRGAKM